MSTAAESSRLPTRVARAAGASLGTLVVFLGSVVVGALLHLDLAPVRRAAVVRVNAILSPLFKGKIRIERIGHLGLGGVSGVDATIDDPAGRPVIVGRGVRGSIALWPLLRSLLLESKGPLEIHLSDVALERGDVRLDGDGAGGLDLADAFASPKPPSLPDPNARGVRLVITRGALAHVWAHGALPGAPPLDVDLDDVVAAMTIAPDVMEWDVAKASIVARKIANGADVSGALRAHVTWPSAPEAKLGGRVDWRGSVGGIAHSIEGALDDGRLDAVVDVPVATPEQIRALWSASTIDKPARAHVEAHGTLPNVDVALHAGVGRAAVDGTATAFVGDDQRVKLTLVARDVDVHEIATAAPSSSLAFTADINATRSGAGALGGALVLRFGGGPFGAFAIPPATIRASGSRGTDGAAQGDLDLVAEEPGAPTHVTAHITPAQLVTFAIDSTVAELDDVAELRHVVRGSASLRGKGSLDIPSRAVDAELYAKSASVAQGTTSVEHAELVATAHGALSAPKLAVDLQAQGIVAAGLHFVAARVRADGEPLASHVNVTARGPDTPTIDASADLRLDDGVSLGDVRVALARSGVTARVTAASVRVGAGDVRVDDARITGIGAETTASFAMTPGELKGRASTTGVDLARVARLAQREGQLQAGTLAFDVDVDATRTAGKGRVTLALAGAKVHGVSGISGRIDATIDGRNVVGKAHAEAAGVATLDLDAPNVRLGEAGPTAAASWRGAWGSVAITASADLAKVSALVPAALSPVDEARGVVSLKAHVARDDAADFTPDVSLELSTKNLEITPKTTQRKNHDGVLVMDPAPWRLADVDLSMSATMNGTTGALALGAVVHDAKGEIVELDVKSAHFPYEDVFRDVGRLEDDLRATAFDVHLSMPERDLAGMPPVLQQSYVAGRFKADVTAKGTLAAPTVDVAATLVKGKGEWARSPIDIDATAHYDGAKGTASIKGAMRGRKLLDAEGTFEAPIADLIEGGGDPSWSASAHAHLDGYPIQSITLMSDKLVRGLLSGDVSLDGYHKDAQAKADITIASLSVGSVAYNGAAIHAKADGKTIDATARVDQPDGFADLEAHAFATWGAALAPTLDPDKPLTATITSKNFRVVALQPFVDGVFDELDGRIDASARVALDPKTQGAQLSGNIALSRGTIEAVAGGGEFHDITGNVKFSPDGTITLEKLTASGLTGKLSASGVAHVSGTTLKSAQVTVIIPRGSAIPLNAGGSEVGNVDGRVELSATGGANGAMALQIAVPSLRVALPEGATTSAEALGPMAKVVIGAHRGAPETFVVIPIDPATPAVKGGADGSGELAVTVDLRDVQVIRGTDVKVNLKGKLGVKSGATTRVTGQIQLAPGGTVSIQGKTFTVESGTVTFVGPDPSNPEVVVQASWTGPEGTVVYANFTGPLRTGKVTLRSEPALSRDEIVELLLFGSPDGQQAQAPTASTQNTAVATAGGEAAAPLNHALGQLGLGAVTTKIDTSQTNPKPEVEVQIARDLSIEIAVVLGVPPPGVNPDTTLLTVDWRFFSKWSLASTVGNEGTTVFDFLWKKRY